MDQIKILILNTSCSTRNIKMLSYLKASLEKMKINNVKLFQVNYWDISYWDSPTTIIFTPTPFVLEFKAQIEVIPKAYMGMISQDEFDEILYKNIKKIRNVSNCMLA